MKLLNKIVILLVVLGITSCQKIFVDSKNSSSNPKDNFEYLWNEVDKKYSYFNLKQVDWNEVYARYSAQITDNMTEEQLFNVLANMLNELKDDHTNLVSPFNISAYNIFRRHDPQIHIPLINVMFPNLEHTGVFSHTKIESENIAYVRFPSFENLSDAQLDYVLERYKNTKGLILDMRDNGGGQAIIVNMILSRLVTQQTTVAYEQIRNDVGHNDFTDPAPIIINPKGVHYPNDVVILIDRGCYSATTFLSLCTKPLDKVLLMGDTTGGGAGLPNGGELPNGWTYRFSISKLLDLNKQDYAENGVAPDTIVTFNWNDLTKDELIEAAIQKLK